MEAPAIPPGLSAADEEAAAVVDCAGAEVVGAGDGVVVEEVVGDGAAVDGDPDAEVAGMPLGPRLAYTSQFALGKAKGQVSSWHRLKSCVPTGGAHRTLNCAFI